MPHLVTIAFPEPDTAFAMRAKLVELQTEYLIAMEDAVVVTRNDKGDIKLHQAANLTARGAVSGSIWGLLLGSLFFSPLLGAAAGAGFGALAGKTTDIGISDDFIRKLSENLPLGGSALFVLVRKATPDKLLARLEPFRGTGVVMQTSLTDLDEAELHRLIGADA